MRVPSRPVEKTQLNYTRIVNGWFLEYYGMPNRVSHLEPWTNILNMANKWAVIPGDPKTRAQDMSSFLARLMDLPEWHKISAIRGNTLTFAELVACGEEVRGCKFQIAIDSVEKLRSGKISFFPDYPAIGHGQGDEAFYAMLHSIAAIGRYLVPDDLYCLDTVFPDVQMTTPMQVMKVGWANMNHHVTHTLHQKGNFNLDHPTQPHYYKMLFPRCSTTGCYYSSSQDGK